jgi:large repetitive protein
MSLPTVMITSEKATQKSMTRPSLSVPNAPQTIIDASGPSATTIATSASFAFSPNETGSKFECSLNGAPFAECASPKEYTGLLSAGGHELRVRSIDRAGNIDDSPESRT